jgi:DNA-binding MarR family transcriptional regulator
MEAAAATSTQVEGLTPVELRAWRGLLRVHVSLVKALDAQLEASHDLQLTSYEVLQYLAEARHGRMRMHDIASSVRLSRSGLTRLVDRLERDGLVSRVSCSDDARGAFACITEAGRDKLGQACATHLAAVRRNFLAHLTPEELEVLADLWERMLPDTCCGTDFAADAS